MYCHFNVPENLFFLKLCFAKSPPPPTKFLAYYRKNFIHNKEILLFSLLDWEFSRADMGLPEDWHRVSG